MCHDIVFRYMCASKTMASIGDFDMCLQVRPCLGQLHRYVATCKTTSGTLALYNLCDYPSVVSNFEWLIGQRKIVYGCIKRS
ncbi:dna topoisomerase 2 [Gossypium arboreum]|uniref:Dna topoisomerase 2 n=1 Tax=Gossypium arboreum TaxID=29729 RepID=A0A0B0PPZ2_GOSAR|nr:dna topoisomerase 2 [Gossypium arboreum]